MACLVCEKEYVAESSKVRTCSEGCRIQNIRNIKNEWYQRNKHKNADYYQKNKERIRTVALDYKKLNREEVLERRRKYRQDNKELIKKRSAEYVLRSGDVRRRYHLKKFFDLTPEDYNKMLESQGHNCKICKRHERENSKKLAVDHCHTTGKIRGILCDNCNRAIGMLQDSPEVLQNAIDYLKNSLKDS